MLLTRPIGRFLDYCRGDYPPAGVPARGFVPLIALLRRRLTDDEVASVVRWCQGAGPPVLPADVRSAIARLLGEPPCDDDAARVTDDLAGRGFLVVGADGALLTCHEVAELDDLCRRAVDDIPGVDAATVTLRRDGRLYELAGSSIYQAVRRSVSYTLHRRGTAVAAMTFVGAGPGRWADDALRRSASLAAQAAAVIADAPWGAAR